ncbi:MAG TPA: DNA gyrase subunit B [Candidatus Nanoarchaeia archaeon]|nr:DNA gyrase subunit B [Candidatus Nanoarchaeia archaeon]
MADDKKKKTSTYDASQISVLEGLEPVRKRPGMYIGTTGPDGFHHLITEIFDNSRDEAMGGHANDIEITFLPNNRVRVVDNGRGIPVDIHKQTKVSALETIMTTLHAGGKFGGEGYKVSGGLHGVGASVVNALSVYVKVTVHKEGDGIYLQEYSRGKRKAPVKRIGPTKKNGTIVMFEPDEEIFGKQTFEVSRIINHMRQQAYLVKGLRISVIDAQTASGEPDDDVFYYREIGADFPSQTFCFEGGLLSLVKFNNKDLKPIHKNIFYIEKNTTEYENVEVSLQYVDEVSSRLTAFANNIYNSEGGTHVTGFKAALTRTLNAYVKKNSSGGKEEDNFTSEDVMEGLTAVISVKLQEIQFEGQTKAKLGTVGARGMVESVFAEAFSYFLEENPDDARAIVNKVTLAVQARKAAKAAKDSVLRKGALEGMTLPGKLADCQSGTSAEEAEVWIVEGESAGGTAKSGRDRRTQAILALRGKILNIERARLDKMLASEQIKNIVLALGTAIGDTFDITKLRYHKVIIATDADVDGAHIRTLILTLFYRFFRPLLEGGFIYIAQPPLYKIKNGKEISYAYSDEEKFKIVGKDFDDMQAGSEENAEEGSGETAEEEDEKSSKKKSRISIQRYKGLGEMNSEELWETTMDPAHRILKQVSIKDAADADKVFDILMGTDVPARKSFIQSNAKKATIDI